MSEFYAAEGDFEFACEEFPDGSRKVKRREIGGHGEWEELTYYDQLPPRIRTLLTQFKKDITYGGVDDIPYDPH
jgi:hypothetical protein